MNSGGKSASPSPGGVRRGARRCLELFLTFARVGACTFGGGYAMLPMLQREVAEKKGWVTEAELADYYAVSQCTPGAIAINTATFIGAKLQGVAGGIAATLGILFPSTVIILAAAAFLERLLQLPEAAQAFAGVRACVCALIFSSVLRLRKSAVAGLQAEVIFLATFLLASFSGFWEAPAAWGVWGKVISGLLSPAGLVILSGLCGLLLHKLRRRGRP